MAAQPVHQPQGLFQVDFTRRIEAYRARQRFRRDVDHEMIAFPGDHRQANAVAGDRVAQRNVFKAEAGGIDVQAKTDFARG